MKSLMNNFYTFYTSFIVFHAFLLHSYIFFIVFYIFLLHFYNFLKFSMYNHLHHSILGLWNVQSPDNY